MIISALLAMSVLIDFSCPPSTLSALEPRLEKAFGAKVDVAAPLDSEVVVVHAEQVSAEVLRAKLAEVVCGKWEEQSDGRWVLSLDLAEEKKREAAVRARYAEAFRLRREADLAPSIAAIQRPWNARELGIELTTKWTDEMWRQMPWELMAAEIMQTISPDDMARAAMGETVVFGNRPGRFVSALSPDAERVIRTRGPQIIELGRVLAEMGWAPTAEFGSEAWEAEEQKFRPWPEPPYWVTFRPTGSDYALVISDDKGNVIDSPMSSMTTYDLFLQSGVRLAPFPSKHSRLLELSGRDEAAIKEASISGRLQIPKSSHEPLALLFRDSWTEWAKAEGAPICVNLPDSLTGLHDKPRSPVILEELAVAEIAVQRNADGWIIGKAAFPSYTRRHRTSRIALKKLFDAVARGRMPTVEEQLRDRGWLNLAVTEIDPLERGTVNIWSLNVRDASAKVFDDLSSEFLARALNGFRGTMADLLAPDQRAIQNWLIANGPMEVDDAPQDLKLIEPSFLLEHSSPDQFSVSLEIKADAKTIGIISWQLSDDVECEAVALKKDTVERIRASGIDVVEIGGGNLWTLTLRIRHESGASTKSEIYFVDYQWKT